MGKREDFIRPFHFGDLGACFRSSRLTLHDHNPAGRDAVRQLVLHHTQRKLMALSRQKFCELLGGILAEKLFNKFHTVDVEQNQLVPAIRQSVEKP